MLGSKHIEKASKYASTGFFSSLICGLIIMTLGLTFIEPLMRLLGSTDTILPYAMDYGRWILIAAPFMTASCVLNNILRYEGKAAPAMVGLTTGGLLNILLDPLFILVFRMGTAGAGLATALSQIVSFCILLYMFLSGKTVCKLRPKNITSSWHDVKLIVTTGFPSLIRQGLGSFSGMLLNHQAGVYGDAAVAAMSIVNRVTQFVFSVNIGIGQGFQPVASFNYGAKRYSRVKQGFWFATILSEILLLVICSACFFFAEPIIRLFQEDPSVVVIGIPALRYQTIACIFLPFATCSNMMFQSVGLSGRASLLSTLRNGLCFIPLILVLPSVCGLSGVQLSQPISDVLAFMICVPMALYFLSHMPADECT